MRISKHRLLSLVSVTILLLLMLFAGFFETWQLRLSDNLFNEQKPLEDIVIIAIDDHSLQELGRWPWDRAQYIPLFEHLHNARAVGFDVAFFETQTVATDIHVGDAMRKTQLIVIPTEFDRLREEVIKPAQGYENITTGLINVFADIDGITRTVPLTFKDEKGFALAIYEQWLGREANLDFDTLRIRFVGPPHTFTTISYVDALLYNFSNKIVLIGATAPNLHDDAFVPTSQGSAMPGVEIHANSIQTLITKQFLKETSKTTTAFILLLSILLIAIVLITLPLWLASIITTSSIIAYIIIAIKLFDAGIILNLIYPLLGALFTYIALVATFYIEEFLEKRRVQKIFGKYVSPNVAQHILSSTTTDEIHLEGEEKHVALLFADIRGFTSMSEKMTPREVVTMLNNYLGKMSKAVFDNSGTLDKYMGDCIMAIFGAPLTTTNPALDAVKCAIEMQRLVHEISKKAGVPKVGVGIGINIGEAIVGNMGSKERVEYTAIGDTVNIASRMCSEAEGDEIVITSWTYEAIKDKVKAVSAGEVTVKGKSKPIEIYKVIGLK